MSLPHDGQARGLGRQDLLGRLATRIVTRASARRPAPGAVPVRRGAESAKAKSASAGPVPVTFELTGPLLAVNPGPRYCGRPPHRPTDRDRNLELFIMNADGCGVTPGDVERGGMRFGDHYRRFWFPDGTGDTSITPDTINSDEFSSAWSPDGTCIAFVTTRNPGFGLPNEDVYVMQRVLAGPRGGRYRRVGGRSAGRAAGGLAGQRGRLLLAGRGGRPPIVPALHHGVRGGMPKGGHPSAGLLRRAAPDRDPGAGLPPVPVGELPGQVRGALVAPAAGNAGRSLARCSFRMVMPPA